MKIIGLHFRVFDSVDLGWGSGTCLLNNFYAKVAGLWATHGKTLLGMISLPPASPALEHLAVS